MQRAINITYGTELQLLIISLSLALPPTNRKKPNKINHVSIQR